MKSILFATIACLGLAACGEAPVVDQKVYTVDELMSDQATLARIYAECGNHPGRLSETPNCKNAGLANYRSKLQGMRKPVQQ